MTIAGVAQILAYVVIVVAAGRLLGPYLYRVLEGKPTCMDRLAGPVERWIWSAAGVDPRAGDALPVYVAKFLLANWVLLALTYLVLRLQAYLPLRPTAVGSQGPALAFNTAVSFTTNTNWQAYAGETLSYLSQLVLMVNQFLSPAFGVAAAAAVLRGLSQRRADLGNFAADVVRVVLRVYLPGAVLAAVALGLMGVPQTFAGPAVVHALGGMRQVIDRGPVAAFEAIKLLGNNGGGFFNANSAHPLENPSAYSNLLEAFLMGVVPVALVFALGTYAQNLRLSWVLTTVTGAVLLAGALTVYGVEVAGNPLLSHRLGVLGPNMEGHEVRFGQAGTALFVAATTAFTTGAVNAMHDSLMPLSGLVPLLFMMLNTLFGSAGAGLLNMLMMIIVTLFISGLMVGRTPEFLGRKIEAKEVKLATLAMLVHPFLVLVPTAFALVHRVGTQSILNPAFHGLSEVLYAYTSASANNGSAFAGLAANTAFYDVTLAVVMLLGRYLPMVALLALAHSMSQKVQAPVTAGTLRTDTWTFGLVYLTVVLIVGALTFFPALSLGPIADQLALQVGRLF